MTKWEYKRVVSCYMTEPTLNLLGLEGWELVCICTNTQFYFKRPLVQKVVEKPILENKNVNKNKISNFHKRERKIRKGDWVLPIKSNYNDVYKVNRVAGNKFWILFGGEEYGYTYDMAGATRIKFGDKKYNFSH